MGSPIHHEKIRRILSRNLKHLLAESKLSENALAQKIKVSQKQVNNITQMRTGCGIDSLAEIAHFFGVEPWMMLVDGGERILKPTRLKRVIDTYLSSSDDDRDLIDAIVTQTIRASRTGT